MRLLEDAKRPGVMLVCVAALSALSGLAYGQSNEDWHHNNIFASFGAAVPTGSTGTYLSTAPLFGIRYGYRFNRLFQADAGLQLAWGAANNQTPVVTDIGPVQGGDHEFMFPLGGRIIIPQPFHRLEFAAGGGGVYLHYSETAPSGGYYQINCYSCTSRGGWGGYGLVDASYFLDSGHMFRIGTTFQYISAATTGAPVGNVTGVRTSDHWANILFGLGISF